jgi:hypothetical protein
MRGRQKVEGRGKKEIEKRKSLLPLSSFISSPKIKAESPYIYAMEKNSQGNLFPVRERYLAKKVFSKIFQ